MASLIYRVLDEHVIHGLADNLAIQDERGTMSYAELLHESASVAGSFINVGIGPGAGVQIDLAHGRELVVAVLACTRIGAIPRATADFRLAGIPAGAPHLGDRGPVGPADQGRPHRSRAGAGGRPGGL